jgi:hypothetical protein
MYVKPEGGGRKILRKTYVVHPDLDFKLLDFVLSMPQYKGRWIIRPVMNESEYRDNTDRNSYRVQLRKPQVVDYRRFMTKENVFMPFLVFDAKRKIWLSGRHRSEAGKNAFGALFALVFNDLTDEESLYITDITNQWHQESWSEDERALIALGWMDQGTMTQKEALAHVQLENSREYIFGAKLYRHLKQGPQDRWLVESGIGAHGHPYSLKTIGSWVATFGEDSIKDFGEGEKAKAKWEHLKGPDAKKVLSMVKETRPTRHMGSYDKYLSLISRKDWVLAGTPQERWLAFAKLEQRVRQIDAEQIAHVSGPSDDRTWMLYVLKYLAMSHGGLTEIKRELSDKEKDQSATVVDKLKFVFGK